MNAQRACRRFPLCMSMLAALILVVSSAQAQDATVKPKELKLSTAVGPAFALGRAGDRWATLIAVRTGAKLRVKLHPGAALADRDPAREFAALREGAADLAVGSTLFWSAQVAELNVIGLPWLVSDAKGLNALVTGTMKERLDAAIERAGAVPLAYAVLGLRALATTATPVQAPGDLAGVRVRTASMPLLADLFIAMRAEPRTMRFADAQAALKAGTLAALEGTAAAFVTARLDALGIRHVVLWGATAEVAVFAANRAAWAGLTDAQRRIVVDAAREAAGELPELARAENDAALAELSRRGVTVTRLTASGRAAFAFATRSAYDKWAAFAGQELARAAEAAITATTP